MTKARAALLGFIGAISLSLILFATVAPAPIISTTASPDNTYVVHLRGRKSRPSVPLIEHAVYFDLFSHGKQVVHGRKLHSGDWFDPAFENFYPEHIWLNSSTLMFYRADAVEGSRDTLSVTNNTAAPIKFLQLGSVELFLMFDLKPQARAILYASPQTWLSWVTVAGEFEDGKSIPRKGVNFTIDPNLKGPFTYDITINSDGPTISSSQLPVYRPK